MTLREAVQMWPPQEQVQTKWDMIRKLDFVAARRTFSARPRTRLLQDGETITDRVVLKRTHSDMGRHVLLPQDRSDRRNWEYIRESIDVPGCLWLAQSYVETLATLGEWRVFLIAGQIVYAVHTVYNPTKRTWTWDVPTTFYSLDEITCVYFPSYPFCWCLMSLEVRCTPVVSCKKRTSAIQMRGAALLAMKPRTSSAPLSRRHTRSCT